MGLSRRTPPRSILLPLHVNVWVEAEQRHKDNEVVLARPDASAVVLYRPGPKTATFDFPAPTANGATPDVVSAAKEVKQLVDKFGVDTVKGLAELFSAK